MLHIVNLLHILASSHAVIERLRQSWYRMLPLSLPSGLFVLPRIQQSRRFASRMTGWLRLPDVLAFPACDRSGVKDHGRLTHTRRQTSLPRIQRQLESIVPIPGKPPAWVLPSAHSTKPFLFISHMIHHAGTSICSGKSSLTDVVRAWQGLNCCFEL
jgi:hypothetical protein